LKLTDFPSADDRPSLPVTPAPIRRPTFWGAERDGEGELPGAEGVPVQSEWDPTTQLEQLRRNSLLELEHLKEATFHAMKTENTPEEHPGTYVDAAGRKLSLRGMPEHAVTVGPTSSLRQVLEPGESDQEDPNEVGGTSGQVEFKEPGFDSATLAPETTSTSTSTSTTTATTTTTSTDEKNTFGAEPERDASPSKA